MNERLMVNSDGVNEPNSPLVESIERAKRLAKIGSSGYVPEFPASTINLTNYTSFELALKEFYLSIDPFGTAISEEESERRKRRVSYLDGFGFQPTRNGTLQHTWTSFKRVQTHFYTRTPEFENVYVVYTLENHKEIVVLHERMVIARDDIALKTFLDPAIH